MNLALKADEIRRHVDFLLAAYPELGEDEALRHDMIDGETDAFNFLSMLTRKIGESKALAEGTEEYAQELRERTARIGRRIDAYRHLAFRVMESANLKKAELPEATLSIRNGTPKVIIGDESALPDNCIRVKREPDKTAIKELLTQGKEVPGAALSNAEPSLSIRIK
jgi:hypothetical protein